MYTRHLEEKQSTERELTTIPLVYHSGDISRIIQITEGQELYYEVLENEVQGSINNGRDITDVLIVN